MLLQPKQIEKLLDSNGSVAGFTTTAANHDDVTTDVQGVLSALGITEAVATATVAGVITSGNNRVEIYDATTKQKIDDGQGNEVYGRLTGTVGAWDLAYFSLVNGVETAYTMDGSDIDFDFGIRFEFKDLPANAIRAVKQKVNDDVASAKGYVYSESVTITTQNTLPDTTFQTSDTATLQVIVNGKVEDTLGATPVIGASTANKQLTWNATNAGYNLDTTDRVVYRYLTKES